MSSDSMAGRSTAQARADIAAGVLVDLSTGEFDMLVAFIEHANRVLSRDMLMEFAKTRTTDPFDRTIDVQVSRLRRKLADGEEESRMIRQ